MDDSSISSTSSTDLEAYPLTENKESNNELELSRTISRKITNSEILIKEAKSSDKPLPPITSDLVIFEADDPLCPLNWPLKKKLVNTISILWAPFNIQIGSAIIAPSTKEIAKVFHVCHTVATLSTSLFIFGFAAGPVIWGPLSELYGRRPILLLSAFGYLCFAFGAATAKDIQTLMICRFFCGFIGGAPAVVTPSSLSDMFPKSQRGIAMSGFGLIIFSGPMIAPIIGGYTTSNLGYRWNLYFAGFFGCVSFMLLLWFKESHHPTLLTQRAEELRRRTGNRAIYAAHEEVSLSVKEIFQYNIARPLKMLVSEPILALVSLYNAFMYGILYLLLTAIPLAFGYLGETENLPYLALFIGIIFGTLIIIFFDNKKKNGPEDRLPPMLVGSILFPIGMFWFGWTTSVHWIVPTLGLVFVGAGLITVFLPCLTYIVDVYLHISASALALNAFLRAGFGGAFPLFAHQMFAAMLIKWGTTLIGCFSLVLVPVPFIFYRYGSIIRSKSKMAN